MSSKYFAALLSFLMFNVPFSGHALTLAEGVKTAVESGRDVKIAQSYEVAARAAVTLARSPWLPYVNLYGSQTWLQYQPTGKFIEPGGVLTAAESQDHFLSYGIQANQLLYDFGKTSSSINAAQYGVKARQIETQRTRNQTALDFIVAYYDLLEAEKLLQVAKEEVKNVEAHKSDAEAKYGAGVITKNEVLQADATLADSRQRLVTAENLHSFLASRVNSLLLRPLNEPVVVEEVTTHPATGMTLDEAWTFAEAESPELKDIDAQIAAKEETVRTTQAEYFPTLYLSGGYEYTENRYMVQPSNWSLIAGVNINLFSGGASSSKVSIAMSELRSLRLARDKVLDNIRLAVENAYLDLQSSREKIEVTKTAIASATENLRLQRLRYHEGVATATDELDAVTLMTTAETNSWKSLYGVGRAEAQLLYSMGRDLASVYGE
ncbi:MAG TPA: TolC family protein [Nitrospirota bacterium]|nr:TolC family protein [Nitrospirota bacterium]